MRGRRLGHTDIGDQGYSVYRQWDGPCPSCQVAEEGELEDYRYCQVCGFDSEEEDFLDEEFEDSEYE